MIFLAEALERQGCAVSVVTAQLSWLTRLSNPARFDAIPPDRRNSWYDADGLRGFIWVPPLHPVRTGSAIIDGLTGPLLRGYGWLMPRSLRAVVRSAELIVIESCSAVALYQALRRVAPRALFIYSMSDRLAAVGMHPALSRILSEDAPDYDLVRVPATAMLDDLPGAKSAYIPHGLAKEAFDACPPSPYGSSRRTVVQAGDMMLDQTLLARLAEVQPDVDFHCFGRGGIDPQYRRPNIVAHGEVAFAELVPFIIHADVGLALYRPKSGLEYLAQSSLKNLQYAYCGLPIVAPHYVAAGLPRGCGYAPDEPASAERALGAALAAAKRPPANQVRDTIADWDSAVTNMVDLAMANYASAGRGGARGEDRNTGEFVARPAAHVCP